MRQILHHLAWLFLYPPPPSSICLAFSTLLLPLHHLAWLILDNSYFYILCSSKLRR